MVIHRYFLPFEVPGHGGDGIEGGEIDVEDFTVLSSITERILPILYMEREYSINLNRIGHIFKSALFVFLMITHHRFLPFEVPSHGDGDIEGVETCGEGKTFIDVEGGELGIDDNPQ